MTDRIADDPPSASLAQGTVIRSGSMEGFRGLLLELGAEPSPILNRAGLDDETLNKPDRKIPTEAYRRALNLAADASRTRHFGLLLSQRQTFEKLGAVGYLVRHAPNLQISIDRLIAHFRTHDTGSMTRLERDGALALWKHGLAGVGNDPAIQQTELAIGLACKFVRSALGDTWHPDCVYFEHGAPADIAPYQAVFRCPVLFGQALTALEFPAADLDRPLRLSDAGLFAILEDHVARIGEGLGEDWTNRVRQTVRDNIEDGMIRIDDISRALGVKKHVLQRKLKAEGANFQSILDDMRFEIARRFLRETTLPIAQIAGILGYAESAVFTRAFARRAAMSPREWRAAHSVR
ncbi:MAG: AraC family transcriptional regulator [Sphingopyxis sp.]|uniref:AraC family transcriptional regulator n=1 Tax=Sphingopyxis sp. TaxID=1908224 RepID=UPI002ABA47D1|nr:AraC family transcriptional regulator [Sphingopyxis sp.]MDZ3832606.1 AraC family transcriptional regulator [Sphingopyxis sp.]